jgi:PadR family transcriptional regulator PadR
MHDNGVIALNVQFKKGVLDLCVMAMLARKDCYGFELASTVSENIHMSEGTVYPLLKRLKDDGLLDTYLKESSEGPPRKYYRLTDTGHGRYREMAEEWRDFSRSVDRIIEGREDR